ncbi:MAG: ATP-dependent Clp protease ATP-binding subunit [Ruminococcaceae bacterium]|nr:ATP-dependent Clp protease ATP-binding subunit [Oscillospiraceae bacterium]
MNKFRFTEKANRALTAALESARKLGHTYMGSEHLLIGLAAVSDGAASQLLAAKGVDTEKIQQEVVRLTGSGIPTAVSPADMTPRTKRILEIALAEAQARKNNFIGTEHILLSILRESDSVAVAILRSFGIDAKEFYGEISKLCSAQASQNDADDGANDGAEIGGEAGGKQKGGVLQQFARDLTAMAKEGKIDPVIGRDREIERIVEILSRRTKNNPCLIGEPGVGKTAVAEGLAQCIAEGNVPELLKGKRVMALDMGSMVAGTKYRGEFEERMKNAIDEVKRVKNVILFIDEIHTVIGAGGAEGAIDAANILKPALARGEIQLIGATTLDEYRKHIEKDAAFERRFQPVNVGEPTQEQAVEILKGLRDRYEAHHKIKISDEAISAAVSMSARYITDRFLPDKAIDLIDEAASRVRIRSMTAPVDVRELEQKLDDVKKQKEDAVLHQNFEKAAALRDEEKEIAAEIEKRKDEWSKKESSAKTELTAEDIAEIVSVSTNIPVKKLEETEAERLLKMEDILHERVVGQHTAVTAVAKAIRRGRVGLKDPKRPIGSFIFLGPTGVGKTELSKALAEAVFGDENALIRIDMSEYMEKHTVSRLVGSPPGYVGYDDAGQLTEKIRRQPYSVVLFDEIEKAHPDVFNILLQILDDGMLTDSHGRRVDFKNSVIIMTSNLGARLITEKKKSLGFTGSDSFEQTQEQIRENVMEELKKSFRPEFLNRVDDIIVFEQLTQENITQIAKNMLAATAKRIAANGIVATFDDSAVELLAKAGFDPIYGARPLKRAIQSRVEDAVAEQMLSGEIKAGDTVVGKDKDGKLVFEKE